MVAMVEVLLVLDYVPVWCRVSIRFCQITLHRVTNQNLYHLNMSRVPVAFSMVIALIQKLLWW